jgi:glutamyl-tRNA synthetase
VRLRFAPSPTGLLHVGNIRPALANYLLARRHGGDFILRFDDTDVARNKPEFVDAIQQDLRWLGITWSESFHQSDRLETYREAARRLEAAGRLYPCFESEAELQAKRDQRLRRNLAPVYDRAMLRLTAEQRAAAEAGGKTPYWRFRLSDGAIAWRDLVLGDKAVKLPTISDPVLVRADGTPLYTFTSVVDDLATGITHIVRGEDHVTNTAVQLDIWAALGGNPKTISFAHLPLLVAEDGGKLSKRTGSLSLRGLRQDGIEPEAITSYLATLGTSEDPVPARLDELAAGFDLSRFSRNAPRFDVRQLLALNRRLLHGLPFAAVQDRLPPGATPAFWEAVRGNLDMLAEARGWWDVVAGTIVPPVIEEDGAFLREALAALPPDPWDGDVWASWTEALKASTGRKGRALFHPLRLALTGEERGPEMRGLLPLIGRARAAERLRVAQS